MRAWNELVSDDDAIALVRAWSREGAQPSVIIEAEPEQGRRVLERLQVTTRSPLGALALHTGGILIDGGWLRVLGSGSSQVPRSLDAWNGLAGERRLQDALLVADDVLGGFFALSESTRTIHYLAPDTLAWEDLEIGHTDWLHWCFSERLASFYETFRWSGWQAEVGALSGDQGLHVYPPLFTKGPAIAGRSRRAVPVEELWGLALDLGKQLSKT